MLQELRDAKISAELTLEVLCSIVDLRVQGWSKGRKFHIRAIYQCSYNIQKFNQFDQYSLDLCSAPFCASFAAEPLSLVEIATGQN
jgi:hypothetical protein